MKKLLILPAFFLLFSCSPILNTISPITDKKVARKGNIKEVNGEIINFQRFLEFRSNIEKGKEDKIKIVTYSIEGDPIICTYKSDGKFVKIVWDMRRDKYGLFTPYFTSKGIFKGFKEKYDSIVDFDTTSNKNLIIYSKYYIAVKQYNQRYKIDTFFILQRKI